jgi:subtilisin family serine protease
MRKSLSLSEAKSRYRVLGLVAALLVLIAIIAIPSRAEPEVFVLSVPSTQQDLPLIPPQLKSHPKLDSTLNELRLTYSSGGVTEARRFALTRSMDWHEDQVRVVAEATSGKTDDAIRAIRDLGGTIEVSHEQLIQALIPLPALESLTLLDAVTFIRLPGYGIPAGVVSEGVNVVGANTWHSAGWTGQGVKIAIVDLGFQGYQALLGSELPASVVTYNLRADGQFEATDHGTAIAEIIHDMAPGAQLFLVAISTDVELLDAVDWLIAQQVNIASCSLGWLNQPFDGSGPLAQAVDGARQNGIFWAQAAGNGAQTHWEGTYTSGDGDNWHDFAPGDECNDVTLNAGEFFEVFLSWWDWPYSANDYDLYLFDSAFNLIASSENEQSGTQPPLEYIGVTIPETDSYCITIWNYSTSRPFHLELNTWDYPFQYQVASSSLWAPGDANGAVTCGATFWQNDALEEFSSRGPTDDSRLKPDLTAPDGVSTQTRGPGNFYGTSSSVPHVAGAAALVKQANPGWTLSQIKSFLESRALDLGSSGKDNLYGAGRLRLGTPPTTVTPTPTRTATPTPTRTPSTGGSIYGRVTANLSPAAGMTLDLRLWDGSSWSTLLTTTTASNGTYNFIGAPSLTYGQTYHVRYLNTAGTPGYLWGWWGGDITSYTAGTNVPGGDFDIADAGLGNPNTETPQALPVTFRWTMRNIASDTYEFEILDTETYEVLWRSGDLGRVSSFTLTSLPPGINPGTVYGWDVRINSPQGVGLSYGTSFVAFTTGPTPPTATPTATATPRPGMNRRTYLPLVLKNYRVLCNGNFEQATLGPCWTSGGELPVSLVTQLSNGEPARGQRTLLLGNPALGPVLGDSTALPPGSAWVEQVVSVPATGTPRLSFQHRVFTYDRSCVGGGEGRTCQKPSDNLVVSINDKPVFRLGYEGAWSGPPPLQDLGWRLGTVDLTTWRGQAVRVRFALWNDEFNYGQQSKGSYNTWGYVDDVVVSP